MASYPSSAALKSAATNGAAKVTAKSGLILRSQPATTATRVTAIPYGTTVKLLSISTPTGWKAVSYGTNYGYASSTYLSSTSATSASSTTSNTASTSTTSSASEIRAISPAPSSVTSSTTTTNTNSSMTDKTKKIIIGGAIAVGVGIAGYLAYKALKKPEQSLSGIGSRKRRKAPRVLRIRA